MFVDLHTHSHNSPDSKCSVFDMALAEKSKGTAIFAVTDHFDYPNRRDEFSINCIINSTNEVESIAETGIEVLKGIELARGYQCSDEFRFLESKCNFDVVIGSVHGVELHDVFLRPSKTDFNSFSTEEKQIIIATYFNCLYNVIEFGCDTVAHISYLARYIKDFDINAHKNDFAAAFEMMIPKNIALEINTGYLYKANCDFSPNRQLIKLYKDMGGKMITLGSDAHTSENASLGFSEAKEMLNSLDIRTAFYFRNRKPFEYEM